MDDDLMRVCQSRGGPYEDEAFSAGWRLARLDASLAEDGQPDGSPSAQVRLGDSSAVHAIAARRGWTVASWVPSSGGWAGVRFARTAGGAR